MYQSGETRFNDGRDLTVESGHGPRTSRLIMQRYTSLEPGKSLLHFRSQEERHECSPAVPLCGRI